MLELFWCERSNLTEAHIGTIVAGSTLHAGCNWK